MFFLSKYVDDEKIIQEIFFTNIIQHPQPKQHDD